jgi:hypothetical protein
VVVIKKILFDMDLEKFPAASLLIYYSILLLEVIPLYFLEKINVLVQISLL